MASEWSKRAAAALLAVAAAAATAVPARAATLPADAEDRHLGVASCASGVCHGSVTALEATSVLQNEFVVWTREDKHAGAYQLLFNEQSQRIARNLGIGNAHEADICLDCHADNVPPERRGEKFQVGDGIGCEACHGGGERWLSSHTSAQASHADNVAAGMYPTDDLPARAALCLSCHLGNDSQFATHRIMGAGHPRLAFELDTFGVLQPAHYRLDADYAKRKQQHASPNVWLAGLVAASRQTLSLVRGPRFANDAVFPEIALFDCHACHHLMDDQRWQATTRTRALGPGEVRLADGNLVLLATAASVLDAAAGRELNDALSNLHASVRRSRAAVVAAAAAADAVVARIGGALAGREIGTAELRGLAQALFRDGGRGEYRDYVAAEQATMGLDLLFVALDIQEQHKPRIDALYASVRNENRFAPAAFGTALANLKRASGL
jgi:hypothetical protein